MADGTKNFLIHRAETLEGDVARLKAQKMRILNTKSVSTLTAPRQFKFNRTR